MSPGILWKYVALGKVSDAVATANVVTAGLQGHYPMLDLNDYSGLGRDLTEVNSTAGSRVVTGNGQRLANDRQLAAFFTEQALTSLTMQFVLLPHTLDNYMGMKIQRADFNVESANRLEAGTRAVEGQAGTLFRNSADTGKDLTHTGELYTVGQAEMITVIWSGTQVSFRRNKTEIDVSSDSGTINADEVKFTPGTITDGGDHTYVYSVWYNTALTATQADSNYDAIRTVVNTRPDVSLPA